MQELFLPVHGHVLLSPEEIAIVDHPSFQRLRRVRQLGFAHVVFPGAVHTRLEHSIGAVHVAQYIIDHVNSNFNGSLDDTNADWRIAQIDQGVAKLIRLGALLHDVGHLPFGHTLEDELNHLRSHDGPERLDKVSREKYEHYELKQTFQKARPQGGWSLKELVNALYKDVTDDLGIKLEPFVVLRAIISKSPKQPSGKAEWQNVATELSISIDLQICRDIVGNTICADFLDYLFRDWYHIGKPLYEDKRLYQYMEARKKSEHGTVTSRFVINVGPADRIRHDALTNILELLEGRYKLAETVLFHRTKLAITALLDRCLLEIRELYRRVGIEDNAFLDIAEDLLLRGSDDSLPDILSTLAAGGDEAGQAKLRMRIDADRKTIGEAVASGLPSPDLLTRQDAGDSPTSETEIRLREISSLISRFKDRRVYTLAYKLKISDFPGPHTPRNPRLKKLMDLYRSPENRQDFLRGMETLCNLPPGSLIMYCPPNAAMNAKIAEVNLLINGEVIPFHEYDRDGDDSSLTRGALWAHIRRFYELWSAQVYIDRVVWDALSHIGRRNLTATLEEFFFQMKPDADFTIAREQVEASIAAVTKERPLAARGESAAPETDRFADFKFPSGLAFKSRRVTQ